MVHNKKRICILVEALGKGGAEKGAGVLSQMLDALGHELHMVTITDCIEYPFAGKLFNLGRYKNSSNGFLNKLRRFSLLRKYLVDQRIDLVIDFRFRQHLWKERLILNKLFAGLKVIYAVRSYHIAYYFPKNRKQTQSLFSKVDAVVALTQGIRDRIQSTYDLNNVFVIPNAFSLDAVQNAPVEELEVPFVLAGGRMDVAIKQFDKLIRAYASSKLPEKGIMLRILGRGKLIEDYKALAKELSVDDKVLFEGFKTNPYPYFRQALFFVQSSKFEGFPMVLLESLACGRPVVAMDCPTGPSELIEHTKNGLLVQPDDFEGLTQAMNELVANPSKINKMAQYAKPSVERFKTEHIARAWQLLIDKIYERNT